MKEIFNAPAVTARSYALRPVAAIAHPTASQAVAPYISPFYYVEQDGRRRKRCASQNKTARAYEQMETRASRYGTHALDIYC